MKTTYHLKGATCMGCVNSIENALVNHLGIFSIQVNLKEETLTIESSKAITKKNIQQLLPSKFKIEEHIPQQNKHKQLFPLYLIFVYITLGSILANKTNNTLENYMSTFMGLFFIVFSFFKFLNLTGFVKAFKNYDLLAKNLKGYAFIYPFIETLLGVLFLLKIQLVTISLVTIFILGITTLGVIKTLYKKENITCACLGSVLNLPMTEATLIENIIMIIMAFFMIF